MGDLFELERPTAAEILPIKAISIWQPWASLIAAGVKRHETRHWQASHRGAIAIHAAKTLDVAGAPEALCRAVFGPDWRRELPLGAIVAVGSLTGCHDAARIFESLTAADAAAGNFAPGRFAWAIDNVRALVRPAPFTGRQGLFNWTPPADLETNLATVAHHRDACRRIGWA